MRRNAGEPRLYVHMDGAWGAAAVRDHAAWKQGVRAVARKQVAPAETQRRFPKDFGRRLRRSFPYARGVPRRACRASLHDRCAAPYVRMVGGAYCLLNRQQSQGFVLASKLHLRAHCGGLAALPARYPCGLEENPPIEHFDIRDSICREVGGFVHGQVRAAALSELPRRVRASDVRRHREAGGEQHTAAEGRVHRDWGHRPRRRVRAGQDVQHQERRRHQQHRVLAPALPPGSCVSKLALPAL